MKPLVVVASMQVAGSAILRAPDCARAIDRVPAHAKPPARRSAAPR
jgi:hypothetical protein